MGGYKKKKVLEMANAYVTKPDYSWKNYYAELGELLK